MALLSRRDFSRAELRERLLRKAAGANAPAALASEASAQETEVDQVLDRVQAQGLLDEQRFVDGFVRTRATRFGPARLRLELLRRGVEPERIEAALKPHQPDECAHARALWLKRFKLSPADARERARQSRFLAARGFSHDVIRRVLGDR